ncbi:MAG: Trk system potassium transporter TrkA [Deltaproteobacteria bacterium]|jgi:trk system potassium uptake protein TrkA|nr:Trk system potassium transporter TrkA [Deltaproteobacteria bacterium]
MNFIIAGAGEVGYHLASRLSQEKMDVVVIEKDEGKVKHVIDTLDVQTIHGSGSSVEILKQAGIEDADMLIAVTDSDEVNMISCLVASAQTKVPIKIARIRNPEYAQDIGILGEKNLNIDLTINPEQEMVRTISRLVEIPDATDVVEFAEGRVRITGIKVDPNSYVIGKKLKNLDKENEKHDIIIAAIFRDDKVIIPRGDDIIQENDLVYAVTEASKILTITNYFKEKERHTQRVMILGGGEIAVELAQRFEKKNIKTKIIEHNEQRCLEIAEKLEKTIVLRGDGTDRELLEEENIKDVDVFITISESEQTNILVSLLAKRLGAKKVISLINNLTYTSLVSNIGVDVVISPHLSAISRILQFIRKGKVLSVASFHKENAEAIEIVALETSDLVNKPLRDIKFPRGAIIGAVVRDKEIIIPTGDTLILPDDRVIIFTLTSAIPSVEKTLTVKMDYW